MTRVVREPTTSNAPEARLLGYYQQRRLGRRAVSFGRAIAGLVMAAAAVAAIVSCGPSPQPPPLRAAPNARITQEQLPFTGLIDPLGVAVDTAGNVYVTDYLSYIGNSRVLKLPAGSNTQLELPFTGLKQPWAVAVDPAGNVYITDLDPDNIDNSRVLKLPAGSSAEVELPFTGLNSSERAAVGPDAVAVDTAGNVYVADVGNSRVLKLPAGSSAQVELPFTGLNNPEGVAVDGSGSIYITDIADDPIDVDIAPHNRVLKLPAGSSTQVELPFTGLKAPRGLTVDTAGNVYVMDAEVLGSRCDTARCHLETNYRVLKLSAGSNTQTELPFTNLHIAAGPAVDSAGNVYVADAVVEAGVDTDSRVLKLPAR